MTQKKRTLMPWMATVFAVLVIVSMIYAQTSTGFYPPEVNVDPSSFAPSSAYKILRVTGFNNDWDPSGTFGRLRNTYQKIWEGAAHLSSGTHEFRFAADQSWNIFWGAAPGQTTPALSGKAMLKGENLQITIPANGRYYIRFDDQTGDFAFSTTGSNLSPVAFAGPDITITCGTIVHFDGGSSYDIDGQIASYIWSNGMTGVKPSLQFDQEGIFEITLSVLDNLDGLGRDTMRVTVLPEIPYDTDFRRETIYSVMTTRFYNGNTNNDFYCRERIQKDDPHWRGDFKGLIDQLDYIKDLGFTAICISPPVENRGALDYQGIYAYDWNTIDGRLESSGGTYRDFLNAAHNKGLKVMQTVVLNHSSNYGIRHQIWVDRLPHKFYRNSKVAVLWPYTNHWGHYKLPFREDNDNLKAPAWFQDFVNRDEWAAGPLTDLETNTKLPKDGYNAERFYGTDEKKLDAQWYHKNGWLSSSDENITASVQGKHLEKNALDLATENWLVKNYLNKAVRQYSDWGVDAIKIEYAGNIDRLNLFHMVNDWKEHKPSLFVCADIVGKGSAFGQLGSDKLPSELAPWWYSKTGWDPVNPDSGGDSLLAVGDYPLFNAFQESIQDGHYGGLGKILTMDYVYGDPTTLITFFHTFNQGPGADRRYKFNGETWKAALAYNLIWTTRGIPCLIAGEEREFKKGAPMNTLGTSDLIESTARAYYGAYISPENVAGTQNQDLYKHIKRLNIIRSRVPALQRGILLNGNEWVSGISFVRDYNDGESYAVVGLAAYVDQSITVDKVKNGTYLDVITGEAQTIASHSLTFPVKGNSAGIWVLNGREKIGVDGTFLR